MIHEFLLRKTMVGRPEKRHKTWEVGQKYMSSTIFSPRHGSVGGSAEMRRKPWEVDQKIFDDNAFSVQNRRVRRPFHNKIEVCDAVNPSQPSQSRDLANPLGVEPLSL